MSQKVRKLAIWHKPSANLRFSDSFLLVRHGKHFHVFGSETIRNNQKPAIWLRPSANLRLVARFYLPRIANIATLPNQKQSETPAGAHELCLNQTYGETFPRLNQTGEGFLRIFKDPWCRAGPDFTCKTDLWAPVRQARYSGLALKN